MAGKEVFYHKLPYAKGFKGSSWQDAPMFDMPEFKSVKYFSQVMHNCKLRIAKTFAAYVSFSAFPRKQLRSCAI
jgi:hypothetical protein